MSDHSYVSCRFAFFFHDPPSTEIYTLSLHDALPILPRAALLGSIAGVAILLIAFLPTLKLLREPLVGLIALDRKSTRLNSSHMSISYAVFCLKKKTVGGTSEYHLLTDGSSLYLETSA